VISLPQCTVPTDFKFAITQGAGGPYTGLSFSSAGTLTWPGGTIYTQTAVAGALDYVSGTISNLTGSNEWDVTGIVNVAPPGFRFVASNSCASSAGAACTTSSTNMTGVDLLVACTSYYTGASGTSAFSDSLGNSYIQVYSTAVGGTGVGTMFYKQAPTVSSSMTFSASAAGGNTYPSVAVMGFSGSVASPLDQSTASPATSGSATTIQPGSLTPSQANELLVSCLSLHNLGTNTSGIGVGSPFTRLIPLSQGAPYDV
jgi:hypothetical protein